MFLLQDQDLHCGAIEVAQLIKELATRPQGLISVPRTYIMEELSTHTQAHTHAHAHAHAGAHQMLQEYWASLP